MSKEPIRSIRSEHRRRRKECKASAKRAIKINYIACIAVCFIMTFVAGEYVSTIQGISAYNRSHVANLKFSPDEKKKIVRDMIDNDKSPEQTSRDWKVDNPDAVKQWYSAYKENGESGLETKELTLFGSTQDASNYGEIFDIFSSAATARDKLRQTLGITTSNSMAFYFEGFTSQNTYQNKLGGAIVSIVKEDAPRNILLNFASFAFSLLFAIFITNVLMVSERRFFLENRTYKKTKIGRLGFLFRERTIHPAKTMFVRSIYYTMWCFTVAGAFIKVYSYAMTPFILAENPNAKSNKVITLSRKMMKGHKWELFKLDVSMLGWDILSLLSLGILGVIFVNPYSTAVKTEFYIRLRREAIENGLEGSEILNDKYLDLELLEKQLKEKARNEGCDPDSVQLTPAFTVSIPESAEELNRGGDNL